MELRIRPAGVADFPLVADLGALLFADLGTGPVTSEWRSNVAAYLQQRVGDGAAVFLAERGDVLAGLIAGGIDSRLPSPKRPDGRIGYVAWLYTHPDHRGHGIAGALVDRLVQWFEEQDITTTDVHASTASEAVFRSRGFATPWATALRRSS